MSKSWLLDSRTIAREIKASGLPFAHQNKVNQWTGFPEGVKFDPSDIELLKHLTGKCGHGNEHQHQDIDDYIPTLLSVDGICYTHPENLPGSRNDGNWFHLFYSITKAHTTGSRKRRKICSSGSSLTSSFRWHQTGKTKVVLTDKVPIGFKKIFVLDEIAVGVSKPSKTNWIMHQFHLGTDPDEKEGEYVVSKISYQPHKRNENTGVDVVENAKSDCFLESSPEELKSLEQNYFPSIFSAELTEYGKLPVCEDEPLTSLGATNLMILDEGTQFEFKNEDLYLSTRR